MRGKIKFGLKILLFLALFAIFQILVNFFALQSFNKIELYGHVSKNSHITLQTTNGLHRLSSKNGGVWKPSENSAAESKPLKLNGTLINRFALVIRTPEATQIETVELQSVFALNPLVLTSEDLNSNYIPEKDTLIVQSPSNLKLSNPFLNWVIPLFLALIVVKLLLSSWTQIPSIGDTLSNQGQRNTDNLGSLDGIRGLAAIIVLLHHSTGVFVNGGTVGVFLFFVLSGFLLSKPFVNRPSSCLDTQFMQNYMVRRFKRIVPMYYFMILCLFSLQSYHDTAFRHFLFLQGDGHFWTIVQEMYFYLLLPFISLLLYFTAKSLDSLKIAILCILALGWVSIDSSKIILFYGQNHLMRAFFEVFLIGMAGSFFFYGLAKKKDVLIRASENYSRLIALLGSATLVFLLMMSTNLFFSENFPYDPYDNPLVTSLLCITTVICASLGNEKNWFKSSLSFIGLRYIGIIGYSFYLIHPYAIFMVQNAIENYFLIPWHSVPNWCLVSASFLVTTVLASITYSLIERPFLTQAKHG